MLKLGLCKCDYNLLENGKYYYYFKLPEKSFTYDYFIYDENDHIIGAMSKYEFAVYFYDVIQLRKLKLNKLKLKKDEN